jgi:hypothetical protein
MPLTGWMRFALPLVSTCSRCLFQEIQVQTLIPRNFFHSPLAHCANGHISTLCCPPLLLTRWRLPDGKSTLLPKLSSLSRDP